MYVKRQTIGKFWPVPRKGTKYLAAASHNKRISIPLVVVLRDVLKIIKNRKELKKLINDKRINVNGKIVIDANFPVTLFDVISAPDVKRYYRAVYSEHKKLIFNEISDKEAETKIYTVDDKKNLKAGKVQVNLYGGRNVLYDDKVTVGDSVVFNFKDRKIERVLELKKGVKVLLLKGRHMGQTGSFEGIEEHGKKLVAIKFEGKSILTELNNIMVVE